ncbi:conserved protein of unknown function [Candidatus Hydrogenisulfobacillus filiaventi]|uniref:HTH cro/C1-type domain-containing protein n=1 Tax=Candidatus Hydrogenisulfobacillus filiaventi TaxID=2707344 RepID=A0A6F8ZKC1_9FIRM|nr:helix-turn-helix transcriptional regulator [Bacillota bacterium]CAB1130052.1 conserved protein of unknown function [Candidatus Hydrogenisulfobacillus filiaventi]
MSDTPSPLAARIRLERRRRRIKLSAVHPHVSPSTVSAVEQGRRFPSLAVLDAITKGLGFPPGAFDLEYLASAEEEEPALAVLPRLLARPDPPYAAVAAELRRLLRRSCSRHPRLRDDLWLALAEVYRRSRRWDLALRILDRVFPCACASRYVNPAGYAKAQVLRGRLHLMRGEPHLAVLAFQSVIHNAVGGESEREVALYNLGLAWWRLGSYAQAEATWEAALHQVRDPALQAGIRLGLGNVALARGRYPDALAYFAAARAAYRTLGDAQGAASALNNRLYTACRAGDAALTQELLEEGIREAWPDAAAAAAFAVTRAQVARAGGDWETVAAALEEARPGLEPGSNRTFLAWNLLAAELAVARGRPAEAEGPVATLRGLWPELSDRALQTQVVLTLHEILERLPDPAGARACLEALRRLHPTPL